MPVMSSTGAAYAPSPHRATGTSASPDPTNIEHQLVLRMSALQSHDNGSHQIYVHGQWNSCFGPPEGGDTVENYTLHGSPATSTVQHRVGSAQSSPRSWDSPEQLGPTPWEAATEYHQLDSRHEGLDPELHAGCLPSSYGTSGILTSFPMDLVPFVPTQSFDGSDSSYPPARGQTEAFPAGSHTAASDGYPSPPESRQVTSPCSATLGVSMEEGAGGLRRDKSSNQPPPESTSHQCHSEQVRKRGLSDSVLTDGSGKDGTPYAKLIHQAFLSTTRRAMTLQEIYQWFRENTDKGSDNTKGWQNSIRHNLSMNQAFTKRDRMVSKAGEGEGGSRNSKSQGDSKKTTEWYLEPWAEGGVQSTTRYRRGNQSRRSTSSQGVALSSRAYRGYPAQHHHHQSSSRKRGATTSDLLPIKLLRGSRQGAAVMGSRTSTNAAPSSPMQAYNHYLSLHPHHHHHAARSAPFIQHQQLLNNPYGSPTPFAPSNSTTTATTTMEYDPQLFASVSVTTGTAASAPGMARASSESGCGTLDLDSNEPVTPEPHHQHHPHHHPFRDDSHQHHHPEPRLLPYLCVRQGNPVPLPTTTTATTTAATTTTTTSPSAVYPLATANAVGGGVTSIYDEVVDRYHGWGGGHVMGTEMEMEVEEAVEFAEFHQHQQC